MLFSTKFGKTMTYQKGLPPIKSHDPLITWSTRSCDKLQALYLPYQSAYGHQTSQTSLGLARKALWHFDHVVLQDHSRNWNHLLYLRYHSAYGHQIWQDADLPRATLTNKVNRPFRHVVLWDHVTIKTITFPLTQHLWPGW